MVKLKIEISYSDVSREVEQANEQRLTAIWNGGAAALKDYIPRILLCLFKVKMNRIGKLFNNCLKYSCKA